MSASRIAASDFLVKGTDNAAVRFGLGSLLDAELVDVVSERNILSQTLTEVMSPFITPIVFMSFNLNAVSQR